MPRSGTAIAALAVVAWAAAVSTPSAGADRASDGDAVVAVLPFTWHDSAHAIYGKAAANALAKRLGGVAGVDVMSISLAERVPSGVALVIAGKLVKQPANTVSLELVVRDPEIAKTVATIPTRTAPAAQLDVLVAEAGKRLERALVAAIAAQRARRARRVEPIRLSPTVVRGEAALPAPVANDDDVRPRLVVLVATGVIAGGAVPVERVGTTAGYRVAERMGYRAVPAAHSDIYSNREAGLLARAGGARAALKVHVRGVTFDSVPAPGGAFFTARGRVRVVLTGEDGDVLFDELIRTDTIVGSRGDRHVGVVRMVLDQALDIAAPHLRRAMATPRTSAR